MSENFFNLEKKPDEDNQNKRSNILFFVVPAIILIAVFGIIIMTEYGGKEFFFATSQKIGEGAGQLISSDREKEEETEEETEEVEPSEETTPDSDQAHSYVQVAEKGEGITHLARKSVTSYMQDNNLDLSDEERIYVEDFLQKEIQKEEGKSMIEIGDEIEFSPDLIEEGIDGADNLTPDDLNNLSQYSALVSF